ncbi:MAG: hypothetical protein ACK5DM_09410, partial [Planctomyces sp.]
SEMDSGVRSLKNLKCFPQRIRNTRGFKRKSAICGTMVKQGVLPTLRFEATVFPLAAAQLKAVSVASSISG